MTIQSPWASLNQLHSELDLTSTYYATEVWLAVTAVTLDYWQTALTHLAHTAPPELRNVVHAGQQPLRDNQVTPIVTANMLQAVIQQGMPALFAARHTFPPADPYVLLRTGSTITDTTVLLLPVGLAAALRADNLVPLAAIIKSLSILRDVHQGHWPQQKKEMAQRANAAAISYLLYLEESGQILNWPDQYQAARQTFPQGVKSLPHQLWYQLADTKTTTDTNLFDLFDLH